MNSDLIIFGEDWGRHPSSTQHLVQRLTQRNVLWMNSIGMRRPKLNAADMRRAVQKLRAMAYKKTPSEKECLGVGPEVLAPRAIPWPSNAVARLANRYLLQHQVKQAMQRNGIKYPILWLSLPTAVDMVGRLGERASVYYCGDDFSALAGVDHRPVVDMERALVEKVDLILVASPMLTEKFPANKTILLPHGTDVSHFQQPQARPIDLPSGRPIAGFYGSLANWLNVEMLASVAQCLSHWNFVMIGEERTDVSALKALPNVHFLGKKPHKDLPAYVQHWQVSLLPFRDNAQIRACNPLKLREYLSTGCPVVSTDFPALDGYRGVVRVANQAGEFARLIELASADFPTNQGLTLPDVAQWRDVVLLKQNVVERRKMAAAESWDIRARELDELLSIL